MKAEDSPLRDANEIQRAHDILGQILADPQIQRRILPLHPMDRMLLEAACNALCWVLKHDHNTGFADNLADLERILKAAGAQLFEADEPFTLEDLFQERREGRERRGREREQ